MTAEMIVKEAMALPPEQRLEIAETLFESVESDSEGKVTPEWRQEIERRLDEIESGKIALLDGEETFRQLENRYQQQ